MRVLSSLRARPALLVLLLSIPAALLIYLFAVRAGEALLAQHPGSQAGSGHALLGQEILGLALLGALALEAAWIRSRLLDVRPEALLSAAERLAAGDPRSRGGTDRDRGGEAEKPAGGFKAASAIERRQLRAALSVLWTSWLESRRATERIPAAMDELASRTLERLRDRLREHRLVVVIPEDLREVQVDVALLERVLTSLLENAARFSPPGTEITVSVTQRESWLIVRVEDRGPGIPSDARESVLGPFVKLPAGAGPELRLSILRAIVEGNGGALAVEDAPGGGMAVVLELPPLVDGAAGPTHRDRRPGRPA